MGYATSLNIENSTSIRIISFENENIQEGDNFKLSERANANLPVRNPNKESLDIQYFISWDLNDGFSTNSEQTNLLCDNLLTKSELNGLARKHFVIQIVPNEILPTQIALRSDILLI